MTESESSAEHPVSPPNPALPLEELELTPEWVKTSGKSHADHPGPESVPRREGRRPGRDRFRARDGERRPRPPRPPVAEGQRPPRPEWVRGGPPRGPIKGRPPQPARPPMPPSELLDVTFQPEEKGFAGMLEAMKQTSRAYALFDIAKLILNKPERHHVKLSRKPGPDPAAAAPLFLVMPDENVFLRQEDAVRFALRQHAGTIFKEKKTVIEPPKGNFTFVSRCGITGVCLGPPNYHEYQSRLIRHHQQRLRHVPFDEFQAHIQTVRDPAAVKAWVDSMSTKTEYECLLEPEPKSFATREEFEKHFVERHLAQYVTSAPEVRISGMASRQLQNPMLLEAVRLAWLEERRFPMKTANEMRGRLRHEGFHFFKSPKGITYISRVKPQRFESISHLSERIQKIIVYLRGHFGCKRKHLIEHLLPQLSAAIKTEGAAAVADPATPVSVSDATAAAPPSPLPEASAAAPPPAVGSSPEQDQLLADLHWLIRDGYVVEFSDGRLWAMPDKPPQPPPSPVPAPEAVTAPAAKPASALTVEPSEDGAGPPVRSVTEATAESSPSPAPSPAVPEGNPPTPTEPAAP
jgi:hypothetical protein